MIPEGIGELILIDKNPFARMLSNLFKHNLNQFAMVWMNRFITEMNQFIQPVTEYSWRSEERRVGKEISRCLP